MSQFSKETIGNVFKIKCPAKLDIQATKDFGDQAKAWMMTPATHYAFDFSDVIAVSRDFYRAVIQLKSVLKPDGKIICSYGFNDKILQQIREDGVESVFNPVASIDDIVASGKKSALMSDLDAEYVKVFIRATKSAIEVQCHTPLQVKTPYLKKDEVPGTTIAAVMPLISTGWSGNFSLCLSTPVFLRIYENMMGESHKTITRELEDAAGEFVNIIYGVAKTDLNPKGHNFQPALPKVLFGENLKLRRSGSKPAVIVPFVTDAGQFHIEVEFEKKSGG